MATPKEIKDLQGNGMLLMIRYVLIGALIGAYISFYQESDAIYLGLLLLFIINNQLRFFLWKTK